MIKNLLFITSSLLFSAGFCCGNCSCDQNHKCSFEDICDISNIEPVKNENKTAEHSNIQEGEQEYQSTQIATGINSYILLITNNGIDVYSHYDDIVKKVQNEDCTNLLHNERNISKKISNYVETNMRDENRLYHIALITSYRNGKNRYTTNDTQIIESDSVIAKYNDDSVCIYQPRINGQNGEKTLTKLEACNPIQAYSTFYNKFLTETPAERINRAIDFVESIKVIHTAGVVHLDLKLENIIIEQAPDGVDAMNWNYPVWIIDFGISKEHNKEILKLIGTPGYRDPLNVYSDQNVIKCDTTNDIYAAGIILAYLLFGDNEFCSKLSDPNSGEQLMESYLNLSHSELRKYFSTSLTEVNISSKFEHKYSEQQVKDLAYLIADCMMVHQEEINNNAETFRDQNGNALRRPTCQEIQTELEKIRVLDANLKLNDTDDSNE